MIEKIVENWLTKSSERTYQTPFCFLLQQEGQTVVHLTRHTAMEHGKDVIALNQQGEPCAYQLKGVSGTHFTLADWQKILPQIYQLVLTPITHPSVQNQGYHKSYLVINSDMHEEVQYAIYAWNNLQEKNGFPQYRLETIVKGQILEMALKHKEQLVPSELGDMKNLLEFYLEDGRGFLDKKKFDHLLDNILNATPPKGSNHSKRLASSAALVCSLAASSYSDAANHLAIVEAWLVYIFKLLRHCELFGKSIKDFDNEIDLAKKTIVNALLNLFQECKENEELFQGNPFIDAFVLQARKTMLVGLNSFLGMISTDVDFDEIHQFNLQNLKDVAIWGETAIPFMLAPYFFYKTKGETKLANEILKKTFLGTLNAIKNPDTRFTNIYTSAEEAIVSYFKNDEQPSLTPRISRVIEPLLVLLAEPEFQELLQHCWPELSRCIFTELDISDPCEFYRWRAKEAQIINKTPNLTQSWSELLTSSRNFEAEKIPEGIKYLHDYLPLVWMVFPQRLNTNLLKWYNMK